MSMRCPKCKKKGKVVDSRPKKDGTVARRYRCTGKCKERWSTLEMFVHFGAHGATTLKSTVAKGFDKKAKAELISKLNAILE